MAEQPPVATLKCLRCEATTPPAATREERHRTAVAAGWHSGKALLCPRCHSRCAPRPQTPPEEKP